MNFTYRSLGTHGALGNQLWEIASTFGIAYGLESAAVFPRWGYEPYFKLSEISFSDFPPLECDLSGNYLQDLTYINSVGGLIERQFKPSDMMEESINNMYGDLDWKRYTALHVRRANNLQLPDHHPVQPISYYEQALEILGNPTKLMVFSDDLDWCRQQSVFANADFGAGNDPSINIYDLTGAQPLTLASAAQDLLAMAKCGQFAISNSTFSWWSAYLSDADYKVVYPKNWYGPAVSADATLMTRGLGWTGI